jgi:hypothetical protein
MSPTSPSLPAESDVRFLEYRLDVISHWPPSGRKQAAAEAISRRLTAIARSTLARPGVDDLMALSCRLLDDVFAEKPEVGDLVAGDRPD